MPHSADPRARALRAMAEVPALVATGRYATGAATAVRAYAEQMECPDQIALPGPDVHIGNQIHALTECGRLNDATALATAAYESTPSTAPPDILMWLSHQLGRCALLSGQVETARRWLGESLARCRAPGTSSDRAGSCWSGPRHRSRQPGHAAAAAAAVLELDRRPAFPFDPAEQELGRAWALVATGDLSGARDVLGAAPRRTSRRRADIGSERRGSSTTWRPSAAPSPTGRSSPACQGPAGSAPGRPRSDGVGPVSCPGGDQPRRIAVPLGLRALPRSCEQWRSRLCAAGPEVLVGPPNCLSTTGIHSTGVVQVGVATGMAVSWSVVPQGRQGGHP